VNSEGKYTDKFGTILEIGDLVQVIAQNQALPHGVQGTVVQLPKAGSDWHGFVRVIVGDLISHRSEYLTDTALRRIRGQQQVSIPVSMEQYVRVREAVPGDPSQGPYPSSVPELADEVVAWLDDTEQFAPGIKEAVANRLVNRVTWSRTL